MTYRLKRYRLVLVVFFLVLTGGCEGFFSPSHHRSEDYTPLFAAADKGDLDFVRAEIEKDPTLLRATYWENETLLHTTVLGSHFELAKYLVAKGIDVNAVKTNGVTALHMASRNSHIAIMNLLLQSGAKVNPLDRNRRTPLDWARLWGTQDAVDLLRQHGGQDGPPKQ
jgi:ankyrin repeat protein